MCEDLNAFSFALHPKVIFGFNTSARIGEEAKKLASQGKRALVITDKRIHQLNLENKIKTSLEGAEFKVKIFAEFESEPSLRAAKVLTKFVRKVDIDIVVGFGGGSCLDMAKVASVMATNPGNLDDYLGNNLLKKEGLPKILIPTTAGTGSEVSRGAVISIGDEKAVISDTRYGYGNVALVDPHNSVTMPPNVTAQSGFDALSHAIESFICTESNRISDTIALQAIDLITKNLKKAYTNGLDLSARYNLSLASLMAGVAFENACLTSAHVFAERIGPILRIPHGAALSITLPIFLELFTQFKQDLKKLKIITKIFTKNIADPLPLDSEVNLKNALKKLSKDLNLPTAFSQIKINEEEKQKIINASIKNLGSMPDPRKINKKRLYRIVKRALK
jgi:alcohol dehydrogenase class IV